MTSPRIAQRLAAEALGTFWLVFSGVGSAITAAHFLSKDPSPVNLGIGFAGVAFAVGLTVMAMAYAVGHVSGGHFNPAVTMGLAAAKRFTWREVPLYIVAQVAGGLLAGALMFLVAKGRPGFDVAKDGFAATGYGALSPGGYGMGAVFVMELICTMFFLWIILGATHGRAPKGFGPIAIGLGLTVIHLVAIPVSNASVNPARTTATAFFAGGDAIVQQWLFWVAPILGALIAGFSYAAILGDDNSADIDGGSHPEPAAQVTRSRRR